MHTHTHFISYGERGNDFFFKDHLSLEGEVSKLGINLLRNLELLESTLSTLALHGRHVKCVVCVDCYLVFF